MSQLPCPACGGDETSVTDSRPNFSETMGVFVFRRRRKCKSPLCSHRFATVEMAEADIEKYAEEYRRKTLKKIMGELL